MESTDQMFENQGMFFVIRWFHITYALQDMGLKWQNTILRKCEIWY